MKKTFPLTSPGKADQRVVESIKNGIRRYVKRERKKPLPAEFDLWEFTCRIGGDQAIAASKPLKEVGAAIDEVVQTGAAAVYVEVLAVPGRRVAPALPGGPLTMETR